jgi:ferredoxin-NADP reductase/uncharacterized protein YcbX
LPYLASISIYPIKSLEPVLLRQARLLPSGALVGDRTLALVDEHGKFVNGKRKPLVHRLRSSFDPTTNILRLGRLESGLQAAFHIDRQKDLLQEWLHEFFGMPVTLATNADVGFPDDLESPGPTIISTATLNEVASWFPSLDAQSLRLRLRANLEIGGVPPFWEDQLYGLRGTTMRFRIGDVVFDGVNPCQRCVVPTRDPATGAATDDFARRFVEMRRKTLPEWAEASRFNHFYRLAVNTRVAPSPAAVDLKVGDPISIIGPAGTAEVAAPKPSERWTGQLRLTRVVQETPTVRTFRLAPLNGGDLPFTYLPGQFLMLSVEIDGKRHRRSYTIASSPTRPGYCEITVKREEAGTISRHLHDDSKCGDLLDVSAPGGDFTFTGTEASKLVLIGAGVGITPLMSKIRFLTDQNWPGQIHLVYSAKTYLDIVFREELEDLARHHPNLKLTYALTQELSSDCPGLRGRITTDLIAAAAMDPGMQHFHICGPTDFAKFVTASLGSIGIAPNQISSEAFGGARKTPIRASSNSSKNIIFCNGTEKSVKISDDQTLLDAADALGISVDHGCLAGVCGRCKVKLASGEVQMQADDGLSDNDRMNGFVLACQSRPLTDVTVEV